MKYLYAAVLRSKDKQNYDVCLFKAESAFQAVASAKQKAEAENKEVWNVDFVNEAQVETGMVTIFVS